MIRTLYALLLLPFITTAQTSHPSKENATDTLRAHYEAVLNEYRAGQRDYSEMPWLAKTARLMKQRKLADSIGQCYITNYLSKLKEKSFFTKDNIIFFTDFNKGSDNRAFKMFYRHPSIVDKIMTKSNYDRDYIDYVISKEEIDSHFYEYGKLAKKLDWTSIKKKIQNKYNSDYAERTVINAKVRWYFNFEHSDTVAILKCVIEKMKKYGLDTTARGRGTTNNLLYIVIFLHSDDPDIVSEGIKWAKWIVEKDPSNAEFIDTYANLLYKSGRREEAIAEDEKAVSLNQNDQEIRNNLQKMKKGQVTWIE